MLPPMKDEVMLSLAKTAQAHDHVAPFNEATMMALTSGAPLRVELFDDIVAAAAVGDAPVEFVVHPRYRRQGRGRALLRELVARAEKRFWAHGDLPGAQRLAAIEGLRAVRTLLVLRTNLMPDEVPAPPGVTIRPFIEDDVPQILAINAAAFRSHPEQGAMDLADFNQRRDQSWFNPEGLFVAVRDGVPIGFHWTKHEGTVGEVYVVGVAPDEHGSGVGSALTRHGMRYLFNAGVESVELYVEGDNEPALSVYRGLGLSELKRDTLYEKD